VAETTDELGYDFGLLGLYDDCRMTETPDNPGYDRNLLGLYDDSRSAETSDILGYEYAAFKILVSLFF
jgi:hypothetical protein